MERTRLFNGVRADKIAKFTLLFLCLVFVVLFLSVAVSSYSAHADVYELTFQSQSVSGVTLNPNYIGRSDPDFDENYGIFPVSVDSADWVDDFLMPYDSNAGEYTPLLYLTLSFTFTYETSDGTRPTVYDYKPAYTPNSNSVAYDDIGRVLIPIYSKNVNESGLTEPYAILEYGMVDGNDYKGNTVTNTDIYDINKAGLYSFTGFAGINPSSTLRLKIRAKLFISYTDGGGDEFRYRSSADPASIEFNNYTVSDMIKTELNVLCRTELRINTNYMSSYYASNLNISDVNRTYGATNDFKSLVSLQDTSMYTQGDNFTFSTTLTKQIPESVDYYNVSNTDWRIFRTPYGSGLGTITEQTTNVEAGANASNSNLAGLVSDDQSKNYLKLVWYKVTTFDVDNITQYYYDEISDGTAVKDAGTYAICIEPSKILHGHKVNTIKVTYNGEPYRQTFTVLPRDLYVDISDGIGIGVKQSKAYDGNNNAESLFSNVPISASVWTNDMNGLAADYAGIEFLINDLSLFVFSGSVFQDTNGAIGTGKTVYLNIVLKEVPESTSPEAAAVYRNYRTIPRIGGNTCSIVSGNKYNAGNNYAITPNELILSFKPEFDNEITYGEVTVVDNISVVNYLQVSETTQSDGILTPTQHPSWRFVFQSGSLNVTSNSTYNSVYVVVQLGRKDNDTTEPSFVDRDGNKYVKHNGTIFAGSYYFYYDVYTVGMNTTNSIKVTPGTGDYLSYSIDNKFSVNVGDLTPFVVGKKGVTPTILNVNLNKDYDGTTTVNFPDPDNDVVASGIRPEDLTYVEFAYTAAYENANAGNPVNINYTFFLRAIGSQAAYSEQIINSYAVTQEPLNGTANPDRDLTVGSINKLPIYMHFLETEYTRKYGDLAYVAIRVGLKDVDKDSTGKTLTEDMYYYYYTDELGHNYGSGVALESKLSRALDGGLPIKIAISSYLAGEGINWNDAYYPVSVPIEVRTRALLTWYDSIKDAEIFYLTPSSASSSDKYRLEFYDNNPDIAGNYYYVGVPDSYAYLTIEKLSVDPEDISVLDENVDNKLTYNGGANISSLFNVSTLRVSYSNHKESDQITSQVVDPTDLLVVLDFVTSCTEHSEHNFDPNDIADMVLSGTYTLRLSLPATTNYDPYSVDFSVQVHMKQVHVYVTFPFRVYGDAELTYSRYEDITDPDDHKVRANGDSGQIDAEGVEVFAYNKDLSNGNVVLYYGFVGSETIDVSSGDVHATVSINLPNNTDSAGKHTDAVVPSGAVKDNYEFVYHSESLYVKKKPLTLTIETNQALDYTGEQLIPAYEISNGDPGTLGLYVTKYKAPDASDWTVYDDDSHTDIISAGSYVLKTYAKPDTSLGSISNNYQPSETRIEVNLTVRRTKLIFIPSSLTDEFTYNGEAYIIGNINKYLTGIANDGITPIPAKVAWGTVAIIGSKLSGESNFSATTEIVDVGEYVLKLSAEIIDDNVYYLDGSIEKTQFEFELSVEIVPTANLSFTVIPVDGQGISRDGDDYVKIYDGKEASLGYSLYAFGTNLSNGEVNVVTTVEGYLFAVNQNVYTLDDATYNRTAALAIADKITGVQYDIQNRPDMLNRGTYTVRFYINNQESADYNGNIQEIVYTFSMVINRAKLSVFITFDDEEYDPPFKIYGEPTSVVDSHADFLYTGWVDGEEDTVIPDLDKPHINWSATKVIVNNVETTITIDEYTEVNGSYIIEAEGGNAPDNYYFDYTGSTLDFVIKPAESWIRVYGFYDDVNGVYTDYTVYNGLSVEKEIATLGVYNTKVKVMRMSGNNEIDTVAEDIGSAGISITYVGKYTGGEANKNNITSAHFTPKAEGEVCKDVGEYVFEISVIASSNYKAVAPKYYYLKIIKADIDLTFVRVTDQNEVIDGRGYASKIYDGSTSVYPSFKIRYSGFLGDDSVVNNPNYGIVYEIEHLGEDITIRSIAGLDLVHPFYEIIPSDPTNIGQYEIRVATSSTYGVARNYNVNISYYDDGVDVLYPILEITPRPIDIIASDSPVTKPYDANTSVYRGLVGSDNYIFLPIKEDPDWCSDRVERELDAQIIVSYCDCNEFGTILRNGGETTGLTTNSGSARMTDSTILSFDSLSSLFNAFVGNYVIGNNFNKWKPLVDTEPYKAYQSFFNKAKVMYNGSNSNVTKNISYNLASGAIIGVNRPYIISTGDYAYEYAEYLTVIARLFGYDDNDMAEVSAGQVAAFPQYAQYIADVLTNNAALASESNRFAYNGAIYTSDGSFVLPYAFKNELLSDAVLAYVIVDNSGLMSIWISDIEAAFSAANYNDILALSPGVTADVDVYGRCMIFEVGDDIPNTGAIEGDVISVSFDINKSVFMRKDVYDEEGNQSIIEVKIYDFVILNDNYVLQARETFTDENGTYIILKGRIAPATASIRFYDEEANPISSILEVEYDAVRHAIVPEITGVSLGGGLHEEVEYTLKYICTNNGYNSSFAPKDANPVAPAGATNPQDYSYWAIVVITSRNYAANEYRIELKINKAEVNIIFGGDIVQTYGPELNGLTAIAYGIGGYERVLTVEYYDENDEKISSVSSANAGVYKAKAVFEESANFRRSTAEENFTILRKGMRPTINVRSEYSYTGKAVVIDIKFEFEGVTYYPTQIFNIITEDNTIPYNYGDDPISSGYPSAVGNYVVSVADDMLNFEMIGATWTNFAITPARLTVKVKDATINVGSVIDYSFELNGAMNGEGVNDVFTERPGIKYFDANGVSLDSAPTLAGTYLLRPYGGVAPNYVLSYDYGMLKLNKPVISQTFDVAGDIVREVVVEGSFDSDVTLVVRSVDTVQYNQIVTAFITYRAENENMKDYNVAGIYNLRLSDGNVTNYGGVMKVRIYAKDLFDKQKSAKAEGEEERYYAARMDADGTLTILNASREGDYIVFETDTLASFAILTASETSSTKSGNDWVLYVGIAVGVLLIGVALLIVKKRA